MRFLLTGGTGFIGQNLARKLRARGDQVRALVRRSSAVQDLERLGVELSRGDLLTGEGLDAAVGEVDCVLHLAGVTKARSEDDYRRGNAEGTRLLAEACARQPKPPRLIYCSSLAAAGPSEIHRARLETDEPAPISAYGRSKLAGELAARAQANKVPTIIIRPSIVYGPADKEFLPSLFPMARLGVQVKSGFGTKRYSLIHVEDLCDALLAAADRGEVAAAGDASSGVYHLSDGAEYAWEEVCEALAQSLGRSRPFIVPVPDIVSAAAATVSELQAKIRGTVSILNRDKARELRCQAWTCSNARAVRDLNFVPRYTITTGLPHAIAWYRQEGLL